MEGTPKEGIEYSLALYLPFPFDGDHFECRCHSVDKWGLYVTVEHNDIELINPPCNSTNPYPSTSSMSKAAIPP